MKGKRKIFASYLKTAKNGMVADLFDRLGFRRLETNPEGDRFYVIDVDDYRPEALPL